MENKISIVHVVLSLEVGGLEVLVANIVQDQILRGWDVHVVCLDTGGGLADSLLLSGVKVKVMGRLPGKIDAGVVCSIRSYIKKNDISIVHSHNFEAYIYGALSTALSKKFLVHSQHGLVQELSQFKKLFSRFSLFSKPALVAVSASVAEHMRSIGWWREGHSKVVLNGVNTEAFLPDIEVRKNVRDTLGINEDTLIVICVARLAAIKDHATLLRIFSHISGAKTDVQLLIVGDGPEREALNIKANELNLYSDKKVTFLGGRTDIVKLLQASDVFMLTSISEGISVSLLEAMSVGLIPVVTSVGGNIEIIQQGQNGYLFNVADDKKGAALLSEAYADPVLRQAVSEKSRQTVIDNFSFKKMMEGYNKLYLMWVR